MRDDMKFAKLTEIEEKALADAFHATAVAMGLRSNAKLPKEVKRNVRAKTLGQIQALKQANKLKQERRNEFESGEKTFEWSSSVVRRR
jgi:3-dehydroquinate synthetase